MTISADDILAVTRSVTKKWAKQRKSEERASRSRNARVYMWSGRVDFTQVAQGILPEGYAHASGNGYYTVEKEGFDPQLREARLADRFDLAIISCKGQSVVAARRYVDHMCRLAGGVPLFVAHDFDKSGFEISQRLTTVSDHARDNDLVKYEFQNEINATDLGLRLADIEKYHLKSEKVRFKGGFPMDTIATKEEQAFLQSGRRVELNAFTAPQFIEWLVGGLTKHGLGTRLIPDDDILEAAYRRTLVVARVNQAIEDARNTAIEKAKSAKIPKSLRRQLEKELKNSPAAWDKVLYGLAEKTLLSQEDDD